MAINHSGVPRAVNSVVQAHTAHKLRLGLGQIKSMRAPQYGQTSWQAKRRTNNAALPADTPVKGYVRPNGFAHSRTLAFEQPGQSTPAPIGHKPVALYGPVKGMRFKHKRHTKLTLPLWRTVPSPGVTSYDAWAGRYQAKKKGKGRNAGKLLKKAYIAKHGSLGGPIISKQAAGGLTEVKATSDT